MEYILLIDDSEANNFLNTYLIESFNLGIKIQTCINGQDAIDFLRCEGKYAHLESYPVPTLILLDINMPVMDGWEFLEEFRTLPVPIKKELIVMMLTTSMNPSDKMKAEENDNVSGFITKPMDRDKLHAIIKEHVKP